MVVFQRTGNSTSNTHVSSPIPRVSTRKGVRTDSLDKRSRTVRSRAVNVRQRERGADRWIGSPEHDIASAVMRSQSLTCVNEHPASRTSRAMDTSSWITSGHRAPFVVVSTNSTHAHIPRS